MGSPWIGGYASLKLSRESAVSFNKPLLPDGEREGMRSKERSLCGRHWAMSLLWWWPVSVF